MLLVCYNYTTNSSLYDTNAIAISALTEVNVLLATLRLMYAVNEASQGVLSSLPRERINPV